MSNRATTSRTPKRRLKAAQAELDTARAEAHSVMAALSSQDLMTRDDEIDYRRLLKQEKASRRSIRGCREYARKYNNLAQAVRERIATAAAAAENADFDPDLGRPVRATPAGPQPETVGAFETEPTTPTPPAGVTGTSRLVPASIRTHESVLSEEDVALINVRLEIIHAMNEGSEPLRVILQRFGVERSLSWARKLRKRYEEFGVEGLLDRRRLNAGSRLIVTPEVERLIKEAYFSYPAERVRQTHKRVERGCSELGIKAPSYESIRLYIGNLSKAEVVSRTGHLDAYDKNFRSVVRFEEAVRGNQQWLIDHTRLDVHARYYNGSEWTVRPVWLTLVVDAASRAIAGYLVTHSAPSIGTLRQIMKVALLPCTECPDIHGIPEILKHDRGPELKSSAFAISLKKIGIQQKLTPQNYPQLQAKVERLFRTIDDQCIRSLRTHHDAIGMSEGAAMKRIDQLVDLETINQAVRKWSAKYNRTPHRTTGKDPLQLWRRSVGTIRTIHPAKLSEFLLRADQTRVVRPEGIQMTLRGVTRRYWSPRLADYRLMGETVRVGYHVDEPHSVLLYRCGGSGEFLCEAYEMGLDSSVYGPDDVRAARTRARTKFKGDIQSHSSAGPLVLTTEEELDRHAYEILEHAEARSQPQEDRSEEEAILEGARSAFARGGSSVIDGGLEPPSDLDV